MRDMIGCFANHPDSVSGIVAFDGGAALMVVSIYIITRPENSNQ